MARNGRLSNVAANAEVDALTALLDDGWFDIYSGTQPSTADDPAAGTLLASLRFASPAFGSGVAGVATSNVIAPDPSAAATGTATWYRLTRADHTTAVHDGSIGTNDANLVLNSVNIQENAEVRIGGFTLQAKKS